MSRMSSLQYNISYILLDSHAQGRRLLDEPLHIPWLVSLVFNSFAHSIASWTLDQSKTVRPVGYEAALACHHIRSAIDVSPIFQDLDFLTFFKWMAVAVGSMVFIVLMLLGMFKFISPVPDRMKRFLTGHIPLGLLQNGAQVILVGLLLNWVLCLILETINVLMGRSKMKKLSGVQFKDDDWGYGQTTAVLLWAPYVCEVFIETWSMFAF